MPFHDVRERVMWVRKSFNVVVVYLFIYLFIAVIFLVCFLVVVVVVVCFFFSKIVTIHLGNNRFGIKNCMDIR